MNIAFEQIYCSKALKSQLIIADSMSNERTLLLFLGRTTFHLHGYCYVRMLFCKILCDILSGNCANVAYDFFYHIVYLLLVYLHCGFEVLPGSIQGRAITFSSVKIQ
jgi:hypothetical protein